MPRIKKRENRLLSWKRWTIGILLLALILCCGCSSPSNGDPRFIEEGIAQYNEGNYKDALWSFERYLINDESSPTAAYAWGWKGITYEELGNYDQALQCIERALALRPNDADLWRAKERVLNALGRTGEAAEAGRRAAQLGTGELIPPTTPTITTIPVTSPTPSPFTAADWTFAYLVKNQTAILSQVSGEAASLPPSEYSAHGARFRKVAEEYSVVIEKNTPIDADLLQARTYYQQALRHFADAGTSEEEAGIWFEKNNYTGMGMALNQTVGSMIAGNENLTLAQEWMDRSGIGAV
jgi:tetratricopeptide (TPR) repeat protein